EITNDDAVGEYKTGCDQRGRRCLDYQVVDECKNAISGAPGERRCLLGLDVVEAVSHRRDSPRSGELDALGKLEEFCRQRGLLGVVLPRRVTGDSTPFIDGGFVQIEHLGALL